MITRRGRSLDRPEPNGAAGSERPEGRSLLIPCVVLVLLAAAGILARGQAVTEKPDRGPIRIGFIAPLSGPNAQNGRDILNGFLLRLEEIGYQAGGRPIEILVEDDEAIPAVGLTKTRKLVERDKVHLLTGALLSSTGYAL